MLTEFLSKNIFGIQRKLEFKEGEKLKPNTCKKYFKTNIHAFVK